MPEWLRQRARLTPNRIALNADEGAYTFGELDAIVDEAAVELQGAGVRAGDIVALLAGNGTGFVATVHACARIGAVLMPLNLRLTSSELRWQLEDAAAKHLVYDGANAEVARNLGGSLTNLRLHNIEGLVGRPSTGSGRTGLGTAPSMPRVSTRDTPTPQTSDPLTTNNQQPPSTLDLDSLATIVYTSGTTGRPKGAMLSYGNHFWSATGSALNLGLLPEDRWLACLPLFHVGGLSILYRSVIYGITAVVHHGFDAVRVNDAIDHDGVTIVSVVAAMLQRVLDGRDGRPFPSTLRCMLLGGGPAPEPLLRRCEALGVPVAQTYGLTETASQVATLAPEDALHKLGSAGKPLFPMDLRIVRDDDTPCAADEPGEIVVRGPSVTAGYLNRPEETARALRGGWLHTGDIGRLDAEGYLYMLDRRDDLIVSGGENVYPAEVEAALQAHPDVVDAGVYGVDDARWGAVPVAVAVLREGASASEEALLLFLRERLAGYKVPSRVRFADELPRNAAGKLLRAELRARDQSTTKSGRSGDL
jgi:O-succinylbenzoic acid--CoA ligase